MTQIVEGFISAGIIFSTAILSIFTNIWLEWDKKVFVSTNYHIFIYSFVHVHARYKFCSLCDFNGEW